MPVPVAFKFKSFCIDCQLKSSSIASNNRQNDNKDFLHYASSCLMLGIYEGMEEFFELTSVFFFKLLLPFTDA